MPKSGTATSNASIPYLMGRNLGSFCGVEVGECIIVNHREVPYVVRSGLGASRLTGCDVEHAPSVSAPKKQKLVVYITFHEPRHRYSASTENYVRTMS